MADQAALAEIEKRIQVVEDNLRQLVEQAAAYSGAADEERNADRIADQQAKLDALLRSARPCSNRLLLPWSESREGLGCGSLRRTGQTEEITWPARRFAN